MPSLKYLGPTENNIDVLNRLRLQEEISGTLTPTMVDQKVTASLASKANNYYLGEESSKYATPSAMAGRGANLINRSTDVNVPGGPVSLVNGRVPASRLPRTGLRSGGRSWNWMAHHTPTNLAITSGMWNSNNWRSVGTFTLPGPNYSWFPIFSGFFMMAAGKGEVVIQHGSRTIARATNGNHPGVWWTCPVSPASSLAPVTGSASFTIRHRAFWEQSQLSSQYHLACQRIPA